MKQKYVRLEQYDMFIFFPELIDHSDFNHFKPILSAGFCYIGKDEVKCFGSSHSLGIESKEEDSKLATKQVFGINSMLNLP